MPSRKRTFRFALRTLLAAVVLCAGLAWLLATRYEQLQLARRLQVASNVSDELLVAEHWEDLDTQIASRKMNDGPSYLLLTAMFTDGSLPDSYERSLLSAITMGNLESDILARREGTNRETYYKVIRAHDNCYPCHKRTQQRPNAPLAIMKFSLAQ